MQGRRGIFLLVAGAAFLFLAFPSRTIEFDAVLYASGAIHGHSKVIAYAGHLGFGPLVSAAALVGQQFTPPISPIIILQYLSMMAGLAGMYILYSLFIAMGTNRSRALQLTAILAFSYAYWHFSLQAESHILSEFFLLLFVRQFYDFLRSPSRASSLRTGLFLGLATLMHQKNILLIPAVFAGTFFREKRAGGLIPYLGSFTAGYFVVAILPYLVVGRSFLGLQTVDEFRRWILGVSTWGIWGKWDHKTLPYALTGLLRSVTGSHYALGFGWAKSIAGAFLPFAYWQNEAALAATVPTGVRHLLLILHVGVLTILLLAVRSGVKRLRAFCNGDPPFALFVFSWFFTFALFFIWWAPKLAEFWIDIYLPLLIVFAWPLAKDRTAEQSRAKRFGMWPLRVLAVGLAIVNLVGSIYPQSLASIEVDTIVAVALDSMVKEGDTVISDNDFDGGSSRFARGFERINLLDADLNNRPLRDSPPGSPKKGSTAEVPEITAAEESPPVTTRLSAQCLSLIDSLLTAARTTQSNVYLIVTPLSSDKKKAAFYRGLVDDLGQYFGIEETVPVRADIDLRRVALSIGSAR